MRQPFATETPSNLPDIVSERAYDSLDEQLKLCIT
jgi:hypothetical protein